jgi:hypothetical protein
MRPKILEFLTLKVIFEVAQSLDDVFVARVHSAVLPAGLAEMEQFGAACPSLLPLE